ncbi:MAG: hypothetical protein JXR89_05320 [Deltaproteobacteria bacterium]|nr:hypothetical protein [Deltaproteobacteria bacterium]
MKKPADPPQTGHLGDHRVFFNISSSGEISAWGLNAAEEEQLLQLTGNSELLEIIKNMSFEFCG